MTLAIAHRGDPVGHIENTLPGVEAAVRAGADMVEIDIRLTADGVPVLLHDEDLSRIWGRRAKLSAVLAAELTELRAPGGEHLPSLVELARLAADGGVPLMVDLPAADAGPPAFDLLAAAGVAGQCVFAGQTRPLREHAPSARIALTWNRIDLPGEDLLEFFRPEYFNPHFQLLTAGVADAMHARGIGVSVWTVDHRRDMAAVITQGADAVITNRIADLVAVVKEQR